MPKKTKNRSSRQAKQARQSRSLAARREGQLHVTWEQTLSAFKQAIINGYFNTRTPDGQPLRVSLDYIRQCVETGLATDPGEPPLDGLGELVGILTVDLETGGFRLHPEGYWILPEEYRPGTEAFRA